MSKKQIDFSNLISMPLDIPSPPDISQVLDSETEMVSDDYRVSPSIVLMSPEGRWMPITDKLPEFVDWAEMHLFPWTMRSQMVVITTPIGKAMAPHIDCAPDKFNTVQHKFRYVFRGNVTDLRWITSNGYVVNKDTNKPYIISGRWPHDMVNTHSETKYTLCLGAPWEANLNNEIYTAMLQKSYLKYGEDMMSFDDWELPTNWREFFNQERYGIPHDLIANFDQT